MLLVCRARAFVLSFCFYISGSLPAKGNAWQQIAVDAVPQARQGHVAVWTGTEMLIWGGRGTNDYTPLTTGSLYNPQTKQWRPMNTTNAPPSITPPASVWTGTELIVCGFGQNGSGRYDVAADRWTPLDPPSDISGAHVLWTGEKMLVWNAYSIAYPASGYIFDPKTSAWAVMSTNNQPAYGPTTAVWTGKEMIIWGATNAGYYNVGGPIGGRYDLEKDEWKSISNINAPAARQGYSVVWTGTEMIVWGGGNYENFNDGARYDPETDTWRSMSNVGSPSARGWSRSVWTGSEFFVWGGFGQAYGTGGRYDPITDTWKAMAPNSQVGDAATVVWADDKMIVWGGMQNYVPYGDGAAYLADEDKWAPLEIDHPPYMDGGTTLWTGREMILISNPPWRFDPVNEKWQLLSTNGAPPIFYGTTAVWTGEEMLTWGRHSVEGDDFSTVGGRYNPVTDTWRPISTNNGPVNVIYQSAVWTGSKMLLWGGFGWDNPCCGRGNVYDPARDEWEGMANEGAPSMRSQHSAVWTGKEMIIWGGEQNPTHYGDGAAYDPVKKSWRRISSINGPLPTAGHYGIWTGREMIICGGTRTPSFVGGRYDPETDHWAAMSSVGAPVGRLGACVVWTGSELWIWGGSTEVGDVSEGAAYNPRTDKWRKLESLGEPRRWLAFGTWTGKEMIVYGGRRLPYGLLDRNTWSYAPAAFLNIEKQMNGAVGVSWLGKFEGMSLESSSTLNAPDWRGVAGIESVGREKRATIVNEQANFYRLRQ